MINWYVWLNKKKINKTLYTMQLQPYIEIKAQCKWKENLNLEQDICWKNIYIIPWNHRYSFKML